MLNQSINLYQERFKEKKVILSATHILLIAGLTIILLLVSGYWYNDRHEQVLTQNKQYLEQKQELKQQLELQKIKLEKLLAENKVDEEINKVSRDISVRKQMIDFVTNNKFGSGEGFSNNLGSLTDIQVPDVWLDEISLSDQYIKLSGSALNADKVPEYFNAFRNRKLFNGRVFDIFELNRKQERNWKIDFIIASKAVVNE
jgi:hypothetical protein